VRFVSGFHQLTHRPKLPILYLVKLKKRRSTKRVENLLQTLLFP